MHALDSHCNGTPHYSLHFQAMAHSSNGGSNSYAIINCELKTNQCKRLSKARVINQMHTLD
jgi:hypothetical protein